MTRGEKLLVNGLKTALKEQAAKCRAAEQKLADLQKFLKQVLRFLWFAAADYEDGASEYSAKRLAIELENALNKFRDK